MPQTSVLADGWLPPVIATGEVLDPAATFVAPYLSIIDNGEATVMTDVSRPTGAMATGVAVTTWSAQQILTDRRRAVTSPLLTFSPANAGEAAVVAGVILATLATAGVLLAWIPFATPIPLPDQFSDLKFVLRITYDPSGRWEASVVLPS